jgi:hypothetical protein
MVWFFSKKQLKMAACFPSSSLTGSAKSLGQNWQLITDPLLLPTILVSFRSKKDCFCAKKSSNEGKLPEI